MGFSRQEYWSELPFPSPGNLPDPGIEPASLMSPALAGGFFTISATWEAHSESESRSAMSDSLPPHGLYIVHGILQARILDWVAFPFSRESSQTRDQTQVSRIAGRFFTSWAIMASLVAQIIGVWGVQISQDGMVRLSCPTFCKWWLCHSWDHFQPYACTSQGTRVLTGYFVRFPCMSFTMKALAAAAPGLQCLDIMVLLHEGMLWLHYGCVMAAAIVAVPARREKTCL